MQWVGLFPRNKADAYLDSIRTLVVECNPTRSNSAVKLTAGRFAGDDALLVDFTIEGLKSRYVVVRHGDLVGLMRTEGALSGTAAKDLGRKAAARLAG